MKATFDEYVKNYSSFAHIRREEGILEVRLHTDDGVLKFDGDVHRELAHLFTDIGQDTENRVIILTGTGDRWMDLPDAVDMSGFLPWTPAKYAPLFAETWRLIWNLLEIEIPVIAAVNGPAPVHAELAALADVVIAADTASFSDSFHFVNGIVPGDGVQIVWPHVLGPTRARYFLLFGEVIDAAEAKRLGIVNEVVPAADLPHRAWELARELTSKPDVTLRNVRILFTQDIKRKVADQLPLGAALEGLGHINYWPGQE
jgi:enoyl-CoA hydratase/carnithine racemase